LRKLNTKPFIGSEEHSVMARERLYEDKYNPKKTMKT
jgi:hypothetical protein